MKRGWIDPPPKPPHDCRRMLPSRGVLDHNDVGRRFRCECGKMWRVAVEDAPGGGTQLVWQRVTWRNRYDHRR